MNKNIATGILKLTGDDFDGEDIATAERAAVFEIKNFIFWNAPIPKLFRAKRDQLHKIERAAEVLGGDNTLRVKDEKNLDEHDFSAAEISNNLGRARSFLGVAPDDAVRVLFQKYEAEMTRAKLTISKAQSAKYTALGLENLIGVEEAFQIIFLESLRPIAVKYTEFIDKNVKLKDYVLSSNLLMNLKAINLADTSLAVLYSADVGGSDQNKKTVFTEWFRLEKLHGE